MNKRSRSSAEHLHIWRLRLWRKLSSVGHLLTYMPQVFCSSHSSVDSSHIGARMTKSSTARLWPEICMFLSTFRLVQGTSSFGACKPMQMRDPALLSFGLILGYRTLTPLTISRWSLTPAASPTRRVEAATMPKLRVPDMARLLTHFTAQTPKVATEATSTMHSMLVHREAVVEPEPAMTPEAPHQRMARQSTTIST